MNKKTFTLALGLFTGLAATAQVNLANFDFNGGTSYPISAATTTTNITASVNGSEANAAYSGTVTSTSAFVQNTTAGSSISMGADDNTNNWVLTLSGSNLSQYMNYKIYFQAEHSPTGAVSIGLSWSTNGSTYTALSQTIAPGANVYADALVDLSSITQLNNATTVYIKFNPSGASAGGGTLRLDNLQIQAALSPWTMSGGNVNFTGGITATSFTTTGDAKINGNLTAGGLTSNNSSLNVTTPVVLSNTLKNTTLAGTGSRLLLTDATGLISPLAAGTSSQVLSGNGTWAALPASTFTASGSNAYFTGGNLGIGNNNPQNPLDVTGNARIAGTITSNSLTISSLAGNSNGGFAYVDANGNLRQVTTPVSPPPGGGGVALPTIVPLCQTNTPWMIGGNSMFTITNAVLGTCDFYDLILESNSQPAFWLKPSGLVGIGIGNNTPAAQLDVLSKTASSTAFRIHNGVDQDGNDYPTFTINNDGATLININSSNVPFTVQNSTGNIFSVANNGDLIIPRLPSANNPSGILKTVLVDANGKLVPGEVVANTSVVEWTLGGNAENNTGTNGQSLGTTDNTDLPFVTNNIEKMRIDVAGNILINTASSNNPNYKKKLTVNGDVCLANYNSSSPTDVHANDGFSGIEILGNNGVPTRRGLSVDADPNGDFNFYINGEQGYGTNVVAAEFNWKNGGNANGPVNLMTLNGSGQLILGASTTDANKPSSNSSYPSALLQVKGDVVVGTGSAANIYVTQNGWADFVFDKNYKLMPLNELEAFYKQNHHLPSVPTTKDIQEKGNNLGQTDVVLLQKIEELTLYMVEQQKALEKLSKYNSAMEEQMQILKKELEKIKSSK